MSGVISGTFHQLNEVKQDDHAVKALSSFREGGQGGWSGRASRRMPCLT